jgi:hypothetical protein
MLRIPMNLCYVVNVVMCLRESWLVARSSRWPPAALFSV